MNSTRLNSTYRLTRFAHGPPLSALAMMYSQVVSFATGIVMARVIGASQYGVANVARSILDILVIASPLGLDLALLRHLGSGAGQNSSRLAQLKVFRTIAFVSGCCPAVLAALGLGTYVEESIYRYPEFASVLLATLVALPFATDLAVLGGAYRGVLKAEPSIVTSFVLQPTFRAIVVITLFAFGWRLWAVIVGTSISYIVSWAILAMRARSELRTRGVIPRLDWDDTWSVFRYSPSLAAILILTTCIRTAESLFLGHFGTATDVGRYGAVLVIAQLIGLVGFAIGQTLGARVALCHRNNDIGGMEALLIENVRWISLISAPIFAAIVFWGDRIDLILGRSFTVEASVVSIVAARMFVQNIFGSSGFALSMTGRHLTETGILAIGLLVSVVLCLALIPGHGQVGAALAGLISVSAVNVARYVVVRSMFGIAHIKIAAMKPVLWAFVAAGATYFSLRPLDHRTLGFTVAEVLLFLLIFGGLTWCLLVTDRDRRTIARLLQPNPVK